MTQLAEGKQSASKASGRLKVAVVGCGYWGPNLVRNFSESPATDVAMACDLDQARLAAIGERHPEIPLTTDYDAVLRDGGIDAIVVATPAGTHYPIVRKALEAGKHVWVEKPLTLDYAEAAWLANEAARRNLALMVDHIFMYTPALRYMRDSVAKGELGRPLYLDSVRVKRGGALPQDVDVVWDMGVHDIYMIDELLPGKPVSVSAVGAEHAGPGVSLAHVTIRMSEGAIGHFYVNWVSPAKIRLTTLCGSERTLVFDDNLPSGKVRVYDGGLVDGNGARPGVAYEPEEGFTPALPDGEPLQTAVRHFADCIANGTTPLTDGEAGARVVALALAAEKSLNDGGREQEVSM
ncbi:MAG: Gfo/Idh/MocA family oxidoreductase [Dehalococcoidia bacterium]